MPVGVLEAPVGGGHPGRQAHAQVEEEVQPSSGRERPVNVKVEEVVRLADGGEDDEPRKPKRPSHKPVAERGQQDDRCYQGS